MVLTATNLYHYLADRGFAGPDSVVDGDFEVADVTRRNRAFQVRFGERPGYVVKQVKRWRDSNVETFEAEVHWYWLARNDAVFAPLAPFLVNCRGYDAEEQILILDVPQASEDLEQHHRRTGKFSVEMAELLGESLGAFHTALPAAALEPFEFPNSIPWAFFAHERDQDSFETISGANQELLRIARKYPGFGESLENLREGWRKHTLINGDMKLAHCILCSHSEIRFIDWEMAGVGDALWDAAGILQEYLDWWIRSLPVAQDLSPEDAAKQARFPLAEIQPAMRAFWRSYARRINFDPHDVARVTGYAAVRMLHRAYQTLQESPQLNTRGLRLLQMSLNILTSPSVAARELLGL